MKWVIMGINKFSGEHFWIGTKYDTREAAKEAAEREICSKCNRIELSRIDEDSVWKSRKGGFQ